MDGQFFSCYKNLVQALGTAHMGEIVYESIEQFLPVDEIFGFRRSFSGVTDIIIAAPIAARSLQRVGLHKDRFHAADPLTQYIVSSSGDESIALKLEAEAIGDLEYRREGYDKYSYGERITLAVRDALGWAVLNLYRHKSRTSASQRIIDELAEFSHLLFPLLEKHLSLTRTAVTRDGTPVDRITRRLELLFPELTERERNVCALALVGATAEATGLTLGIKPTSVNTYRRRAYQKLNISSAAELTVAVLG